MKKIIDLLTIEARAAFKKAGYDEEYGLITLSNRPDLCQYQCNGALVAAKKYKKAPIMIANDVAAILIKNSHFSEVKAIMPGFINLKLNDKFLVSCLNRMNQDDRFGCEKVEHPKKTIIDYGGPNIAKPLHVGHLRSAIIGESIKRISCFVGDDVTGDVHLGDWGLQMGLIIIELKKRQPTLVYFDDSYTGEYPKEAPFTISELEEIYPYANAFSKEHPEYKEEAMNATHLLQTGKRGYMALWNHILNISISDLKRNYHNLNVSFELWKKESDAQPYIPDMVQYLKDNGYAKVSQGALVVDVKEETDTKEVPPCMILKSDGSSLYNTTDLATMVERRKLFDPDQIIYVVDKRQELYFTQVFRCAKKTKIIKEDTGLVFLGFGTMNGKDGRPFKTRDGGVMRLENLIKQINEAVYGKVMSNRDISEKEAREIAKTVGLAAIKYGDLSNQASKDYVFDLDRFTSFEGNTGPYILYTIVRIKSIIKKYREMTEEDVTQGIIIEPGNESERLLMLELVKFNEIVFQAYEERAPHKLCQFIYELSDAFSHFYHDTKIISEKDEEKQKSFIALILLTKNVLNKCIELLGIEAPERM